MRRRLVLAGALALAGCGGGQEEGGDRATYVKAGNAICADYDAAIGRLGRPSTLGDIGPYIAKALPVLRRTVDRLEKLDPPGNLADGYEKFRDAARQTVTRAEKLRDEAANGDGTKVQALLAEAARASKARVGLARDAGLETCARI